MISYGKQHIDKSDILKVSKVLKNKKITQGKLISEFEKKLSYYFQSKYSLVCNSGTSALHLAFKAINLKQNDVVLMPAINFISSFNISLMYGAKIYLVDIDPETGQISKKTILDCVKKFKLKKIKLLITMYLGGYVSENIEIYKLKKKYNFTIIEDACHALGSHYYYENKRYKIGSCKHSDLSVFSLHPLKTITTGEGGIVCTNKKYLSDKINYLRSHGIIRNKKKHWDYQIESLGFNYRLSDINCALGLSQLKRINKFIKKRRKVVFDYKNQLKPLENYVNIMNKEKINSSSCHLIILKFDFKKLKIDKDRLLSIFLKKGFFLQQHYKPIFLFKIYQKNKVKNKLFPKSMSYFNSCISFPVYFGLDKKNLNKCIKVLKEIIDANKLF